MSDKPGPNERRRRKRTPMKKDGKKKLIDNSRFCYCPPASTGDTRTQIQL